MLAINSTNYLEYSDLTDDLTGELISDAEVEARIIDRNGEEVETVTLSPVEGTEGLYRGTLSHEVDLIRGQIYSVELTISAGSTVLFDVEDLVAEYR